MKKLFNTIILILSIYGAVWLCRNLDFVSVWTSTADLLKYEFSAENLSKGFDSLFKALK